eukprot:PLAT13850.1.p2 GENE.PLAT13850.1~~PLAT13850.1.p2  ORF type:complete len:110 (-),score=42.03 PLAT13850.1:200-505(-)
MAMERQLDDFSKHGEALFDALENGLREPMSAERRSTDLARMTEMLDALETSFRAAKLADVSVDSLDALAAPSEELALEQRRSVARLKQLHKLADVLEAGLE